MVGVAERLAAGSRWADDVAVALAPLRAYARLASDVDPVTWRRALERPFLVLLILGTAAAMMATGRVTAGLIAACMAAWTTAVAVQVVAGAALVASAPRRPVAMPAALHLLFAGHLPWSLWLLCAAAAGALGASPTGGFAHGVIVPSLWTGMILSGFCRSVLRTSVWGGRLRALAHQLFIWSFIITFGAWAAGGWFRLF